MLQRIGKYEILERVGRGGQGTVYRARDTGLDRIVAIKVLDQSVADDPGYLDALRREAQLAASLDHLNIVTVYALEVEGDIAYIVMEYVADSLDRQIRSGRIPSRRAVEIAEQVCSGLAHAHNLGVVHRDIKPANILLTATGEAKVTDFGIARAVVSSTRAPHTSAAGTYAYMPPEQWEENPPVDRRSDIYAVGVTLFEMLVGTVPFAGSSVIEMHRQHQQEPVPPLPRNIRAPSGLGDVIQKAMAKRPTLRFQTAREMADALGGLFGASGADRRSSPASLPNPPVVPPRSPAPPQPPLRPRRPVASASSSRFPGDISNRVLFGGLAAFLIVGIVIVVVLAAEGGGGDNGRLPASVAVPPTRTYTSRPPTAVPTKRPTAVPTKKPTAVPPTSVPPTTVPTTSSLIATFQGRGSTTTLPFTVDSNPWIMDLPSSGGLTVNLMSARTGNYAGTQVDDKSGEYLVYGETGEFYLSVFPSNSYGDKPWTIQIKTP